MLWTDKYRPKRFEDVAGNAKQKKIIQTWVEKWKNNERIYIDKQNEYFGDDDEAVRSHILSLETIVN